jgi:glycosyltransferase involved in cell wall biosynthesis
VDRVLMVAYHFPPLAGSSGIQRTLRFVQQLPSFGWQPLVLSAHPRACERTSADLESEIPQRMVVRRAFALDTARHLALGDRYARCMARPDRWISWKFDGVRQGMQLIREFRPRAIWSTYPIATAHLIGAKLHRLSGVPWVADFRDPMAQEGYPADPSTHRRFQDIEKLAIRHAASCTFTAPGAARLYRERYPSAADRIVVLENGYDEESFLAAEEANRTGANGPLHPGAITLLHSGLIYPVERNPAPLFEALASLRGQGLKARMLKVRFRAAIHDDLLRQLAKSNVVEEFVEILPPVGYLAALQEMMRADALLVMQGADCNEQIPAKVYEYLRARRPILCLADAAGDTARLLRQAGLEGTAPLESAHDIATMISTFVTAGPSAAIARKPTEEFVQRASRRRRSEALAQILDGLPRQAIGTLA